MRRVLTAVAIILLLTSAAPVLACMSGATMNHAENACCMAMHGQCGEMAKTGCCRTEVRDAAPQLATHLTQLQTHWLVSAYLAPALVAPQQAVCMQRDAAEFYFPPGLLSAKTTVLRI